MTATGIRGVAHLVLNVTDPEASARFYCDVFGFTVTTRLPEKGIIGLDHESAGLGLGLRRRPGVADGHPQVLDHIAFGVGSRAELDDCAARLVANGHAATVEDTAGGWSITLLDPDGNEVEFFAAA